MFARWSQENFFKYMREHYGLDRLVDYATAEIPDTTAVVNPDYRRLDGQVRSKQGHLTRKLAAFSAMNLTGDIEPKKVAAFEQKQAELQEQIEGLTKEVDALKTQRKAVKHHLTSAELPAAERFKQLSTHSKHLIDTIKMVAYRAETAMAQIAREKMPREDDARSLLVTVQTPPPQPSPTRGEGAKNQRLAFFGPPAAGGGLNGYVYSGHSIARTPTCCLIQTSEP